MGNLNTCGSATIAERKNSYALAKRSNERECYWRGTFGPNGNKDGKALIRAKVSSDKDAAAVFPDRASAWAAANADEKLDYFRVVKLYPRESTDGFKTRWWMSAS